MQRYFLLSIIFLCGFLNIQGQEFGGGITLGASTSQVSGDQLGGFNKIGLLTGVFTNIKIKKKLVIQFEITLIQKGSRNPNIQENNINEISLNYIETPVMMKLLQKKGTSIELGFLPAILLNGNIYDFYGKIDYIDPQFKDYDLGVFAGFNYPLNEKINLNSRISNSIIPIRNHTSNTTFGINKGQYNTILSFAINYNI
tara:strand:+ start:636 stop:1232 length:597 start_codon:yes stop_codon:yes gene_type:complete